jgi:hypothetical protein
MSRSDKAGVGLRVNARARAVGGAAADGRSSYGRGDRRWAWCAVVVSRQTICAWREIGWRAPLTGTGVRGLAEEQAALRRVATLVARRAPPEEVFAAVTEEVARLFPTDWTVMCRYVPDGAFTIVGSVGSLGRPCPVGGRWPLGGKQRRDARVRGGASGPD